ncbi:ThiF family adenylyltransferase [Streptomyces sp. ISL-94]|nr:ThiF family adenylyltransferase [Streptomyces sp. ISL-94]
MGVGSVGSYLAEVLVRSGVGRITLVDPDRVEPANLGRSMFDTRDIGRNKAKATARRLKRVNRRLKVTVVKREVAALDNHTWHQRISDAQLVIAATDDNHAQQRLNHLAYFVGRPALFVGLYEGAAGGEVVFTTPGSPCWACATGGVRESLGELGHQPRTDYGTGRTYAVPGLLTDIHHLTAAAAKIALALMHPTGSHERILLLTHWTLPFQKAAELSVHWRSPHELAVRERAWPEFQEVRDIVLFQGPGRAYPWLYPACAVLLLLIVRAARTPVALQALLGSAVALYGFAALVASGPVLLGLWPLTAALLLLSAGFLYWIRLRE